MPLHLGDNAPGFTLSDQDGKIHSLADYAGQWVLLYFYPKDDTPGCTTEACTIRDGWSDFIKAGIVVLGVSTDSVKSHKKFAQKYELPFPLLADEKKDVVKLYGVWGPKTFMGREFLGTKRWSLLIKPDGPIAKIYEDVKPAAHAVEVLADIKKLK
jgi:peroxiredoxin Q/BCP